MRSGPACCCCLLVNGESIPCPQHALATRGRLEEEAFRGSEALGSGTVAIDTSASTGEQSCVNAPAQYVYVDHQDDFQAQSGCKNLPYTVVVLPFAKLNQLSTALLH